MDSLQNVLFSIARFKEYVPVIHYQMLLALTR